MTCYCIHKATNLADVSLVEDINFSFTELLTYCNAKILETRNDATISQAWNYELYHPPLLTANYTQKTYDPAHLPNEK